MVPLLRDSDSVGLGCYSGFYVVNKQRVFVLKLVREPQKTLPETPTPQILFEGYKLTKAKAKNKSDTLPVLHGIPCLSLRLRLRYFSDVTGSQHSRRSGLHAPGAGGGQKGGSGPACVQPMPHPLVGSPNRVEVVGWRLLVTCKLQAHPPWRRRWASSSVRLPSTGKAITSDRPARAKCCAHNLLRPASYSWL